jgi:hypothetical protein
MAHGEAEDAESRQGAKQGAWRGDSVVLIHGTYISAKMQIRISSSATDLVEWKIAEGLISRNPEFFMYGGS